MSDWLYDEGVNPDDYAAFVYLITNTLTGQQYIGRKFTKSITRKRVKTKPGAKNTTRILIRQKLSDWRNYWGSCTELLADIAKLGEDKFTRQITHWCRTRGEAIYLEVVEQFKHDVLHAKLPDGSWAYYNQNIMCRFYRAR